MKMSIKTFIASAVISLIALSSCSNMTNDTVTSDNSSPNLVFPQKVQKTIDEIGKSQSVSKVSVKESLYCSEDELCFVILEVKYKSGLATKVYVLSNGSIVGDKQAYEYLDKRTRELMGTLSYSSWLKTKELDDTTTVLINFSIHGGSKIEDYVALLERHNYLSLMQELKPGSYTFKIKKKDLYDYIRWVDFDVLIHANPVSEENVLNGEQASSSQRYYTQTAPAYSGVQYSMSLSL